jgi:3-carboxy-cis,cis-muconate cycloisomerase
MSGLQSASIHENERSGSSWSLEWMLLPALIITASKSILNASELIKGAQFQPPQSR